MTVVFADGTKVQIPSEHKVGFVSNDLEWLQYVHGEVSCINPSSSVEAFSVTERNSSKCQAIGC